MCSGHDKAHVTLVCIARGVMVSRGSVFIRLSRNALPFEASRFEREVITQGLTDQGATGILNDLDEAT